MALVICSECGGEVSNKAAACPRCGAPVQASAVPVANVDIPEKRARVWPWLVAAPIVLFFGVGFVASQSPEGKAKAAARDAIDLCWKNQGARSATPAEQRFIAGACEGMEADFVQRYGVRP